MQIRDGATVSSLVSGAANAQVVREADGYQAHLVSPEFGLRRLVDETIGMVLEPVNVCVRRVHQVLLDAARCWSCPARRALFSSDNCRLKQTFTFSALSPIARRRTFQDCGTAMGFIAVMRAVCFARSPSQPPENRELRAAEDQVCDFDSCVMQGGVQEGKPDDGQQRAGREQGAAAAAGL